VKIYQVEFAPENWMLLMQLLSQLDRFDASWQAIERREGYTLKELKSIATVRSVGASTRIEGSRLSDKEVEVLIDNLDVSNLSDRDQQEVAGYYETLNLIGESYRDISISESGIKHLHNFLMKYSQKDSYHKGEYKINSNRVERTEPNGTKTIIFETTPPGWATQDAMARLINWYNSDTSTHALVRIAIFIYEFLSIHPFQDGNGRLSRLLSTLLLLKSGYVWIEYVSFEHEIEHRKKEYYKNLMDAQRYRPGENVTDWVYFFLGCLKNIQQQLLQKVIDKEKRTGVGMREQAIYAIVENNPGISSGEIANRLKIPNPTVKRILSDLVRIGNLTVHGAGRGTSYSVAFGDLIRRDIGIRFTSDQNVKDFTLPQMGSFLRIKKIVLTPLFEWKHPEEWRKKLFNNGLYLNLQITSSNGLTMTRSYSISGFSDPSYFQPVFIVHPNITLPDLLRANGIQKIDYPVRGRFELLGSVKEFDFDVILITDEG
jgi:Fic family protein